MPDSNELILMLGKHFKSRELFPESMVDELTGYYIWGWLDFKLLMALYLIRSLTDIPLYINRNGFQNSGFRTSDCGVGKMFSAHRIGKALDLHTKTPEEMTILTKFVLQYGFMLGLTEVEDPKKTKGWLHISTRQTGLEDLKIINS